MVTLKRRPGEEDEGAYSGQGAHLIFRSDDGESGASVVGAPGDIRTRLWTKDKNYEFGHPFVAKTRGDIPFIKQHWTQWAQAIEREFERVGQKDIKVSTTCKKCGRKT